jgi:hypothetical protein
MRLTLALLVVLGAVGLGTFVARAEEPAPSPERIAQLIQDLGSDEFRAREQASAALAELGDAARPALEKAMAESQSLEVRWRAEQLLRRLDRQGEAPLSTDGGDPVEEAPAPGLGERPPADPEALRKFLEKRFGQRMRDIGGLDPLRGWDFGFGTVLEEPGLRLERDLFGGVTLTVQRDGTEDVYRGRSLEEILAREPSLKAHPGMADLEKKLEAKTRDAMPRMPFFGQGLPGSGMTITSSSGVEITSDGRTTKVKIREIGPDGKEVVKEYEGKDLDEIKREHPEIADRLGMFSFRMDFSAPRIFRGRGARRLLDPLVPQDPAPTTPSERAPSAFGIDYTHPIESVLAFHLGLEPQEGMLVISVAPGSLAEKIGLRPNDVIVSVNGAPPVDERATVTALRKAANDDAAPLALEVIRAGSRTVISR